MKLQYMQLLLFGKGHNSTCNSHYLHKRIHYNVLLNIVFDSTLKKTVQSVNNFLLH